MSAIRAGLRAAKERPLALAPLCVEGIAGALLMTFGALPDRSAGVPATALFPVDVFFDLKQSIAFGRDWFWVAAAVGLGVLVRSAVLAGTLWLADGAPGPFAVAWWRSLGLTASAAAVLFPSAAMFFVAVATRYAPFVWVAALLGLPASLALVRRAVRLDVGAGSPGVASGGRPIPEVGAWLGYAYLIAALGACISALARIGRPAAAILLALLGPAHAMVLLGWREYRRQGRAVPGGGPALVATAVALAVLFGFVAYDRLIGEPRAGRGRPESGTLLVLGGVDSTSSTGALAGFDPALVGLRETEQLSYRAGGRRYTAAETRGDLDRIARIVAGQIDQVPPPKRLLGHSQASLIADRILIEDLPAPDRIVVLAPAPPLPPSVDIPPPDRSGPGKAGGDVARFVSRLFEAGGFAGFDVDAPASPTNVDGLVVVDPGVPRLAVWALGDSVWLDRDWRRPGETNIVAMTDHVGVTNNAWALKASRAFLEGRPVDDESVSLKAVAVNVVRYVFEPWRPQ